LFQNSLLPKHSEHKILVVFRLSFSFRPLKPKPHQPPAVEKHHADLFFIHHESHCFSTLRDVVSFERTEGKAETKYNENFVLGMLGVIRIPENKLSQMPLKNE